MNPLQTFLDRYKLDEHAAMDLLQDAGIVSDCCLLPKDVAPSDCQNAVRFLKENTKPQTKRK